MNAALLAQLRKANVQDEEKEVPSDKVRLNFIETKAANAVDETQTILIVGPGSGASGFNKAAFDKLRVFHTVVEVHTQNATTGEALYEQNDAQLRDMGVQLASHIQSHPVDLIIAGSRGGQVVATMLKEGIEPRVKLLVLNGFLEPARAVLRSMHSNKPSNFLVVLTAENDFTNRSANATKQFLDEFWGGTYRHYHFTKSGHQIVIPDGVLNYVTETDMPRPARSAEVTMYRGLHKALYRAQQLSSLKSLAARALVKEDVSGNDLRANNYPEEVARVVDTAMIPSEDEIEVMIRAKYRMLSYNLKETGSTRERLLHLGLGNDLEKKGFVDFQLPRYNLQVRFLGSRSPTNSGGHGTIMFTIQVRKLGDDDTYAVSEACCVSLRDMHDGDLRQITRLTRKAIQKHRSRQELRDVP